MIAIDITTTQNQYAHRGIGVFTKAFIQQSLQDSSEKFLYIGFDENRLTYPEGHYLGLGKSMLAKPQTRGGYIHRISKAIEGYNHTASDPITKIFYPFIHSGIAYVHDVQTYVFVHDLIQKSTGVYSTKSFLHNRIKQVQYERDWSNVKKAYMVFTNSQTSKDELMRYYPHQNVAIAYLGIDHEMYFPNNAAIEQYILYYGGYEENKNTKLLINLFEAYKRKYTDDTQLVILGDGFSSLETYVKAKKSIAKDVIFKGFVSDEEKLTYIHSACLFMNFASYEGFGVSVMENIACGVPVLISDISIYRELYDGCAVFVPIHDAQSSLASTPKLIHTLIHDSVVRHSLIENELARSKEFDWGKTYNTIMQHIHL